MKIKDVTVEIMMGDKFALSWIDYNNQRYHIWLNPSDRNFEEPVIYKNPPLGVKYRDVENGYYNTRHLDLNAKANRPMYDFAHAYATEHKLFEAAGETKAQAEAEENRQRNERIKLGLKQAAAVQMFNTLELIQAEHEIGNVWLTDDVREALRQTLAVARGENPHA